MDDTLHKTFVAMERIDNFVETLVARLQIVLVTVSSSVLQRLPGERHWSLDDHRPRPTTNATTLSLLKRLDPTNPKNPLDNRFVAIEEYFGSFPEQIEFDVVVAVVGIFLLSDPRERERRFDNGEILVRFPPQWLGPSIDPRDGLRRLQRDWWTLQHHECRRVTMQCHPEV